MRLIHVLIPDERRDPILGALEAKGIDYAVIETDDSSDDGDVLVEFPLPSDGVGDVLAALENAGLDRDRYTVVATAETASTPNTEALESRYADDFDPMTPGELRSKARDMARDRTSFVWMIFLSAIIATAGLLLDSAAVVVGSMVIAPMVGPVLTASVGAVTGDREMLVDSVRLQALGLVVAIVTALAFGYVLKAFAFVPSLQITALSQISSRVAPSLLTVAVGLAAGSASAWGLTTKGPTSLIGVMIAAALIPAAATVGIAAMWGFPVVAVGSLVLLLVSLVGINVAAFVTLWYLEYRPDGFDWREWATGGSRRTAIVALAVLAVVVVAGGAVVGTYLQISYERTVNQQVSDVLDDPAYANLTYVGTTTQFGFTGSFFEPETITVTVSRTSDRSYPRLVARLQRRITAATNQNPKVRVHFVDYETPETSDGANSSASAKSARSPTGAVGANPGLATQPQKTLLSVVEREFRFVAHGLDRAV